MPSYTLYYFNGRGRAEVCRMMFNAAGVNFMDKRFEFSEWDRYRNEMPSMCVPVLEIDGKYKMPETMAISRYLAREFGFYPKNPMDMMRCDYICDCFYDIMHDYMRYYHWKNGRFRNNMMGNTMMSSGMSSSGMSPSGMNSGMMGSSCMMGSNMGSSGMMGSNMGPSGMMGSNMGPSGMMGSNMGPSGMMGSNMGPSGMMGSDMMTSGMSSGMMSSDMSNYDNYMYWRYMNTFNRIMPFMERTLSMRNGGSHFFMGDMMMWCDMMFYCCMENLYMQNQSMFSSYPRLMSLYNRVAAHPKICSYLKRRCNTSW